MRWLSSLLALLIVLSAFGQAARKAVTTTPDTPHLAFVKEFVRELSAVEDIRASSEAEMKQDQATQNQTNSSLSSNMIHTSTLYKLELGSEIETLNGMHLSKPYDFLIPTLTGFYKAKIGVWDQMGIIATKFLETPKPGVDYGSLVAQMSQLRARLDFTDQSIFQVSPAVFMTLLDLKPDSQGHVSHLLITNAERQELIHEINADFGSELGQKNESYTVGAADTLKTYLLKDYKSSDDPWD